MVVEIGTRMNEQRGYRGGFECKNDSRRMRNIFLGGGRSRKERFVGITCTNKTSHRTAPELKLSLTVKAQLGASISALRDGVFKEIKRTRSEDEQRCK